MTDEEKKMYKELSDLLSEAGLDGILKSMVGGGESPVTPPPAAREYRCDTCSSVSMCPLYAAGFRETMDGELLSPDELNSPSESESAARLELVNMALEECSRAIDRISDLCEKAEEVDGVAKFVNGQRVLLRDTTMLVGYFAYQLTDEGTSTGELADAVISIIASVLSIGYAAGVAASK